MLTLAIDEDPGRWIRLDSVGSTNDYLLGLHEAHGTLCVAREQTTGRGRRGSSWVAQPGDSLICSARLSWPRELLGHGDRLRWLPLLSGLAVRESCARLLQDNPQLARASQRQLYLKWPNDVLLVTATGQASDLATVRKIAGVLVESTVRGTDQIDVIIGIGVNVRGKPPGLSEHRVFAPGTLLGDSADHAWTEPQPGPETLLPGLVAELNARLKTLQSPDITPLREEIEAVLFHRGGRLRMDGQKREYRLRGVRADGALALQDDCQTSVWLEDTETRLEYLQLV